MKSKIPNSAQRIVEAKRDWHSSPPGVEERTKGFAGWRSRGYLPHFDREGLYQFITFRLADALPVERRQEWAPLLAIKDERERFRYIEKNPVKAGLAKTPEDWLWSSARFAREKDRSAGVQPARRLAEIQNQNKPKPSANNENHAG
jgi:hypothetical protein